MKRERSKKAKKQSTEGGCCSFKVSGSKRDWPTKWDHPFCEIFIPLSHRLIKRICLFVYLRRICVTEEEILVKIGSFYFIVCRDFTALIISTSFAISVPLSTWMLKQKGSAWISKSIFRIEKAIFYRILWHRERKREVNCLFKLISTLILINRWSEFLYMQKTVEF